MRRQNSIHISTHYHIKPTDKSKRSVLANLIKQQPLGAAATALFTEAAYTLFRYHDSKASDCPIF